MKSRRALLKGITPVVAVAFFGMCSYIGRRNLLDCYTDSPVPPQCLGEPFGLSLFPQPKILEGASAKVNAILRSEMKSFQSHPALKKQLKEIASQGLSSVEVNSRSRRLGQDLVRRGIPRLSSQDLDEWNRIRIMMAERSDAMCAGLWSGTLTPDGVDSGLSTLGEPDLRAWLQVSSRAGILELEFASPVPVDPDALEEGLRAIALALPESERIRLAEVIQQGTAAKAVDACYATRVLLPGAQRLEPRLRERFLRALASS